MGEFGGWGGWRWLSITHSKLHSIEIKTPGREVFYYKDFSRFLSQYPAAVFFFFFFSRLYLQEQHEVNPDSERI